MRKQIALLLCLALLAALTAGCGAAQDAGPEPAPASPEEHTAAPETEPTGTENCGLPDEKPAADDTEPPAGTDSGDPADEETVICGHYSFQPKVCSSYMRDLFGEPMVEAWYALVDAVMAGEDTFPCPDKFTYDWVMGQFPDKCFPVLPELIDYCYDRSNPVVDGTASFTWKVPKEEAAARIAEFAALVEGILNETIEDDYSDFEKALALYEYFARHYVYDYEAARPDVVADYLSSYRVLTTGTGICQEFSVAYSYLLLQAGVDASTMSGHRSYDNASHQWSYVKINGRNYHIDPTYGLGDGGRLSYFMMTDAQREAEDCYSRDDFVICSCYAQEYPPETAYVADDDSFRDIWGFYFSSFDHETKTLCYWEYSGRSPRTFTFDYTGW